MTILPRRAYQDPAIVLEEEQAETCAGCRLLIQQEWKGVRKWVCKFGKVKGSERIEEMQRCGIYDDGTTVEVKNGRHV